MIILKAQRDRPGASGILTVSYNNTKDCKANWQFDAAKYVNVKIEGGKQLLGKQLNEPYPNLFYVFVALGEKNTNDRYFILSWKELVGIIMEHHKRYLDKHGGVRPCAPKSTHCSIGIPELLRIIGSLFFVSSHNAYLPINALVRMQTTLLFVRRTAWSLGSISNDQLNSAQNLS